MKISPRRQLVYDYLWMTVGTLIMASGVYFFKFPNHFTMGGVTGVAVVLSKLLPFLSVTQMSNALNLLLLLIGVFALGKGFAVKTAYCTVLLTVLLTLFEQLIPLSAPLTDQPFLELMFAVLLPSLGGAILFNVGSSSGGTDVVALLLKKYAHVYNTGTALMISDLVTVATSFFVFDLRTGLFSLFGWMTRGIMLDNLLNSLNINKYFHIITTDGELIRDYITHTLKRSATLFEGTGAYTGDARTLIIAVMSPRQAVDLRAFIRKNSPKSFILINNTSEIVGRGFRQGQ